MVYVNVIKQNNPVAYYNAKHKVNALIEETKVTKDYKNTSYAFDNYSVNKTSSINKDDKTVLLEFKIVTGSKSYIIHALIPFEDG